MGIKRWRIQESRGRDEASAVTSVMSDAKTAMSDSCMKDE